MNYSRTDRGQLPNFLHAMPQERNPQRPERESFWTRRKRISRQSAAERQHLQRERDVERGYSINVKQVVLAFAIEFVIIGLILNSQYFIGAQSLSEAQKQIISSSNWQSVLATFMNFPVALAMVELARVPLALAVRTSNSWNIKLCAAIGVLFAITVTSFSLSTIAYQTFDPRLVEAQEKNSTLQDLRAQKEILANEILLADRDLEQKIKDRDNATKAYNDLQSQITAISTTKGENCTTITGTDGSITKKCVPTNVANKAQLQTLQNQLIGAQKNRDDKEAAVAQAEAKRAKYDPRGIDEKIVRAEADYRSKVASSQLHSYTAMIMFKAPKDVTEAEVKSLEKYWIFIPSIAAAFASTLLAITAVRRIKQPEPQPAATIPDEAATYLFGPLVTAIKKAAKDAIAEAMSGENAEGTTSETVKIRSSP